MNGSDPVGYSVFWFTLVFINAGLAQSKGRRGLVWGTLTVIMGPLATLLIVLLKPTEPFDIKNFRPAIEEDAASEKDA